MGGARERVGNGRKVWSKEGGIGRRSKEERSQGMEEKNRKAGKERGKGRGRKPVSQ